MTTSSDLDSFPQPGETDLTDDRAAARLVAAAFPPLRGDAAVLVVPACCGRSDDGVLCVVDDVPDRPDVEQAAFCLEVFAGAVVQAHATPGLLVAFQRRGDSGLRETDTVWVEAARRACGLHGVAVLGIWLLAGDGEPLRLDA